MPRDCTALPHLSRSSQDVQSPSFHRVSNTMTNNKNKQVVIASKITNTKNGKVKETFLQSRNRLYKERGGMKGSGPMQYAGHVGGAIAGSYFGMPTIGSAIGGAIGHGVGYFTGTGDYRMNNFASVSQNACTVPGFGKGNNDSVVVTHREYVQDVLGTTAFTATTFALNPGQPTSFPWLAQIACNYEEYEILGMVYEFWSTSGDSVGASNTALGTIIMATEYDPTKPVFTSKQAMENYSFATSNKPSQSFFHAVECKKSRSPVKELYVRTGNNTGTDLRWTDFGNFTLATIGNPLAGANLGELWVSYKVRLSKPRLPITLGFAGQIASGRVSRSGTVSASPLGTATTLARGPLALTVTGTTVSWFAEPLGTYFVYVGINAGTSSTALSVSAGSGITGLTEFNNSSSQVVSTGGSLISEFVEVVQSTNTASGGLVSLTFNANTVVGTSNTDIFIMQLDSTVTIT